MAKLTHPDIPGTKVNVPDSSVPFHRAAGWVPAEEPAENSPAVADADVADTAAPPEGDRQAAQKRRADKKEADA